MRHFFELIRILLRCDPVTAAVCIYKAVVRTIGAVMAGGKPMKGGEG
jgi:hypothetical protein